MKYDMLVILILIVAGCQKNSNSTEAGNDNQFAEAVIDMSGLSVFQTDGMTLDSIYAYGGGDCFGDVYHFTGNKRIIVVDSLTCGEYGFTFTHYLLNRSNDIQAVRKLKWESIINNDATGYTHILSEHLYDFQGETPTFYNKRDTMDNHFISMGHYPDSVSLKFSTESSEDYQPVYEQLRAQLENLWKRELVE
ncbi:hypothetical protein [Fulvivirga sedimenti]|uniref:Uncharacterized protein n=1 Tax=Fulvivirga sedimenti TaxID=2879465 RepID=A0A9X1HMT9_9BACT|nr:hypothetical protein [Fulvivirga sedimenti]MCA6075099.1 hypothetical protein [Fulvivirga sedimenti]MCA6076276.1 hypothetical protein [Fulvivirga sedimenti]MCA6077404.1 hypothetical protein [Fulvivirga sedimenti]